MARSHAFTAHRSGPERALLGASLALVLALAGWRAFAGWTAPHAATTATASEARLVSLLETRSGPGTVRIGLKRSPAGDSYLVLIDAPSDLTSSLRAETAALLAAADGFNPDAGDTLLVRVQPFAAAGIAGLTPSRVAEIAALLATAGLLGAALVKRSRSPAPDVSSPAPSPAKDTSAATPVALQPSLVDAAGHSASADPKAAAQVLRRWMRPGDAA